jgi:hypothetical protein
MKTLDLTHTGGLPLDQDLLQHMQLAYTDIVKALYGHLNITDTDKYIIAGCVVDGSTVSDGWMIIEGELMKFTGGSHLHVKVFTENVSLTFEDTDSHVVQIDKDARSNVEESGVTTPLSDFKRLYEHFTIQESDCDHLADRCYKYRLPKHAKTITLDSNGNTYANGGFILTQITPFENIPNGYDLMVRCGDGTGLSFVTKNSEVSNLVFNRAEFKDLDQVLRPFFGLESFIGSRATGPLASGQAYDYNLCVFFRWHESLGKWVEVNRISTSSI